MKRYYDSVNFLINYLQFQSDLLRVSGEQSTNNTLISDTEEYVKTNDSTFPETEVFEKLYDEFIEGRDKIGKFTWYSNPSNIILKPAAVMKISGDSYRRNKILLKGREGEL